MGLFDLFQSKEKKHEVAEARRILNEAGPKLAGADQPGEALAIAQSVSANTSLEALSDKERMELTDRAFTTYWESLLADDILTSDEEEQFLKVSETLGLNVGEVDSRHPELISRLLVATVNDGRLAEIEQPQIIRKRGEVVHLEVGAQLLKEVAVREFRAGSQGLSFQVAKGVRYRVGGMRGRMVTVGSEMQVQDTGTFSVTSQRVAYLGSAKSSEILFTKLMGMEVFSDGIRLQASNRQNPLLFRFTRAVTGDAVAATINAAMQRTLD
jgi:hypothetical protein